MNMSDIVHDPRTSFTASKPTITKNPDGSWKVSSTEVRYNIYSISGYHPELITTLNQNQLTAKGYMQSPNDWKNVEITAYLKLNTQGGDVMGASGKLLDGHYIMYARGGRHIGFGLAQGGCEATSYQGDWAYNGATRFAKEQWHNNQNGKTAVKLEIWVDAKNNG